MFVIYAMLAYLVVALAIAAIILRRVSRREARRAAAAGQHAPQPLAAPVRPLHRTRLAGRTLRFYRSPLDGPDFPWTALRDLFDAVTDGASYTLSAEWIYAHDPELAQAVITDVGVELLLSHRAGLELLGSLTPEPERRAALAAAFHELMAEAYVLQCDGLSREDFLELCSLAASRPCP